MILLHDDLPEASPTGQVNSRQENQLLVPDYRMAIFFQPWGVAPIQVVQKVDNTIHSFNLYPLDKSLLQFLVSLMFIPWIVIYSVDNAIQHLNQGPRHMNSYMM